jgi:hypothetical protein
MFPGGASFRGRHELPAATLADEFDEFDGFDGFDEFDMRVGSASSMAFTPDGSILAIGAFQGVCLWPLSSGHETSWLRTGRTRNITALAVTPTAARWAEAFRLEFMSVPSGRRSRRRRRRAGRARMWPLRDRPHTPTGSIASKRRCLPVIAE